MIRFSHCLSFLSLVCTSAFALDQNPNHCRESRKSELREIVSQAAKNPYADAFKLVAFDPAWGVDIYIPKRKSALFWKGHFKKITRTSEIASNPKIVDEYKGLA